MNTPSEIDGKYLGTISQDFVKVADTLKEASYQIRHKGFDYPIFVTCAERQPLGLLLLDKGFLETTRYYYASFLDEFIQTGLVDASKKEEFINNYKDPDEFCCLFVLDEDFTNFVYIPYPED